MAVKGVKRTAKIYSDGRRQEKDHTCHSKKAPKKIKITAQKAKKKKSVTDKDNIKQRGVVSYKLRFCVIQ